MSEKSRRWVPVALLAYVAGTFAHIAYVVNREPYAFDAWNVSIDTGAKAPSFVRFFSFWHQQYTTSNPRIGQPITYLAYKLVGFAELATPLAFFAVVLAGFVLGVGRWPSLRSWRDSAVIAIGIGFMWFSAPYFPAYMFCRAYATNYLYSAAFQLWFLVPFRLYASTKGPTNPLALAGLTALGIVAGMGNEHVGPTLILFTCVFAYWRHRQALGLSRLLTAGTIGLVVGYALLFFAPGQGHRYDAMAEHYSALQQIKVRGLAGNFDIFLDGIRAAAPLLILLLCAVAVGLIGETRSEAELASTRQEQRRSLAYAGLALFAGILITITVFASPKIGPRFYIHAMLLLLSATMAVCHKFLYRTRTFIPFLVLAALASGYAVARTVPLYTRLHEDSDERLAQLASTAPGGVTTLQAWEQIPEEWWFLGDDARDQMKQELIAKYFGLQRVLFRGNDQWATLGVTDVKLTMHYEFDRQLCLDEVDGLDLKAYVGRDVGAIHHAFLDAIAEIQRVAQAKLARIDLVVSFVGDPPPMPRKTLYVARWDHGALEGHVAHMRRLGGARDREIVMPPELKTSPWDVYVARVGDAPKLIGSSTSAAPLSYVPWKSGAYWVLACKADYCFVVFTVSHHV